MTSTTHINKTSNHKTNSTASYFLAGVFFVLLLAFPGSGFAQSQEQNANAPLMSKEQMAGLWFERYADFCFYGACTKSGALYKFSNECHSNWCVGSRQGWFNNGGVWKSTTIQPYSFMWTLSNNQLVIVFPYSNRTEVFKIYGYDASGGRLGLQGTNPQYTIFQRL